MPHPLRAAFPPGFTFADYLSNTPPVTGHLMGLLPGFEVGLPCKVITFNPETKTAIVKAADGMEINVVNVEEPIKTRNVLFWGKVISKTTLQAGGHKPLKNNHNFERAQGVMEDLCRLPTWDEELPTPEELAEFEQLSLGPGGGCNSQDPHIKPPASLVAIYIMADTPDNSSRHPQTTPFTLAEFTQRGLFYYTKRLLGDLVVFGLTGECIDGIDDSRQQAHISCSSHCIADDSDLMVSRYYGSAFGISRGILVSIPITVHLNSPYLRALESPTHVKREVWGNEPPSHSIDYYRIPNFEFGVFGEKHSFNLIFPKLWSQERDQSSLLGFRE
ncbi:hypothetical protein AGABI1DRAFT_125792 [Agaricus bisporus var. burnettii JB137-S8]|uniref:Uncharacterized protein n=1 Tax=Agaricus bisporus var. burnettii (strain JB137-S8 / ATCC MYA-4627 / FGSC 10392) TaxID=597362 RepID=K5XDZ7_AGABU|nr:uncharacterized protein AGABI1DRAFT_125792 [Agaricus bisporus var. burnettii JB137-S8]EKM81402.1 hypothetical protein AGABI1DRAFT_125792 [Agaricus bisporus var. burnettii JB137-S8]